MPDSPTPDAKGAQPEQLVEQGLAQKNCGGCHELATALSECREALRIIAKGEHSQPASFIAADALAGSSAEGVAQPPSEASERSGT